MATLSGGDLVVKALQAEGVKHLFALNGGHIGAVFEACAAHGLRIVDTRHEETAAHMAHGWARATGEPGVALVTAGAGVTNAVTGVANAFAGSAPMVLIGGHCPVPQIGMGAFHEIDQVSMMRPITKWAATVYEVRRIPEYINTAFRKARSGRPGPVFIDIPADLLRTDIDESEVQFPQPYRPATAATASDGTISSALELLASAKRPLVIAGSGVWWSQATGALRAFLERTKFPVITTQAARGVVPTDHPQHFRAARSYAMSQADVIFVVGARFNFVLAYGQPPRFNGEAKVIQIDIDPAEIGRNRAVDLGIAGDAGAVLRQFNEQMGDKFADAQDSSWQESLAQRDQNGQARFADAIASDATPIHPLRLCEEVRQVLKPDATVIADGGDILSFARLAMDSHEPGRWMDAGTFGCLGEGLGFAMASKLARPESQVVALIGDGAFGLNAMEMDTAARHNIPIVVVVSNNAAWNIEKQTQILEFGRPYATDLNPTRYDRLAEILGCYAEHVERPEDIRPALERALASGRPSCLNVVTDPNAISPDAVRMLGAVPAKQAVQYQ